MASLHCRPPRARLWYGLLAIVSHLRHKLCTNSAAIAKLPKHEANFRASLQAQVKVSSTLLHLTTGSTRIAMPGEADELRQLDRSVLGGVGCEQPVTPS